LKDEIGKKNTSKKKLAKATKIMKKKFDRKNLRRVQLKKILNKINKIKRMIVKF